MKSYYLIFLIFIEIGFSNGLFINEFLASNDTTNMDEAGEFDDWLELYNAGNEATNIGGFFLTDNADNLTKWMIPEGTGRISYKF